MEEHHEECLAFDSDHGEVKLRLLAARYKDP
jgi:hypothetical protein